MRGYLYANGRFRDLGVVRGRVRLEDAALVSKTELLSEARNHLVPAALALLAWRIDRLGSVDTVIGLVASSQLVFFEMAGNADAE